MYSLQIPTEVLQVLPTLLVLVSPVVLGVKYVVQITKGYMPFKDSNSVRMYTTLLGLVSMVLTASFFGAAVTVRTVGVEALFGVACGFASMGDYHLLDFLRVTAGKGSAVPVLVPTVLKDPAGAGSSVNPTSTDSTVK